jgi:tripartite ATP-independent transporter DctM subunit
MLLLFFSSLAFLLIIGMPVAFSFLLVNIVFMFLFWGGHAGLMQLIYGMFASVASFTLLPIPLFTLMGEVMFVSGVAPGMMDAVDKWLGRLRGRLSLLAVAQGTVLSTLTGSSMASVAVLGSVLVPEMEKRGYKNAMSLGPILGSAGLAVMIPPSGLAVLIGAIGEISVGKILVAIIVPGLLIAALYATYIITRCNLQPSVAPAYDVPSSPLSEKLIATVRDILPLGFIIFLVVGVVFVGVATPSEAAASGAVGTLILAAFHRKLNWTVVKKAFSSTLEITVMIFMIIAGAIAFAQIIAYSGASRGLVDVAVSLPVPPLVTVALLLVVVIVLGMWMSMLAILLLCLPLFVPVVIALGFDPVWFAVLFLLGLEMGATSPPFGLCLFVAKGVAPPHVSMKDIYLAALPFLGLDLIAMVLILMLPSIGLWLPGLMF